MGWVRCGLGTPSSVLSLPTPSEASGAIARFNTDLTENLLSAVAEFSASQASGTPTPSTPIPIVGVDKVNVVCCGVNVCDEVFEVGDIDATTGQNAGGTSTIRTKNYIPIKPDTKYFAYISGSGTATLRTRFYDINKNYIGTTQKDGTSVKYNEEFTTPSNAYYLRFTPQSAYGTTYNNDISINYPSTDTAYHAYTGSTTAIINLGGTYYGGEVDAVTGKITLTHKKYVFDENLPQSSFGLTAVTGYKQFSYTPYINEGKANTIFLSDKFGFETVNTHSVYKCWNTTSVPRMFLALPDTVATKADAISWFENNPTEVVAELATPIVVYASNTAEIPTIVGDNQVFADSGNIAVKFFETVGHKI